MEIENDSTNKKIKNGSFQSMNLNINIYKGLNRMGYKVPTPVQRKTLPIVLAGMDCVCMARTGSGKTCVFLLPMLEKLLTHNPSSGVRGIVLSPTRELAKQTYKFACDMAKFTNLRIISICGGDPLEAQFDALSQRPDIIIATPGRLMHHLREISTFKLKHVQYLVFDEADRLFEMGFAEQLNEIVRECPQERQTLLFSATMPVQLVQFSRAGLRDPQLIRLETDTKMSEELRLGFFCVRTNEKVPALMYLVRSVIPANQLTIIFTATKHHSEFLHFLFEKVGLKSTIVYGSMDQDARNTNLKLFRDGEVNFLIVTDVAARGLDVPLLNNVINFHFPTSPKLFVHRCGRAARQGRIGYAFSIIDPEEFAYMADVHTFIGKEIQSGYPKIINNDNNNNNNTSSIQILTSQQRLASTYTLSTMTPTMIHTGIFPPDILAEEADSLNSMIAESMDLQILWRISENGMKQYRRTRPEATRTGVKIAKKLSKTDDIKEIHPLIAGMDPKRSNPNVIEKANFIKHLQSFRPSQTVFESGIGTGTASAGSKNGFKKTSEESYGVQIMKALRKVNNSALERNQKKITSETLLDEINEKNNDNDSDSDNDDDSIIDGRSDDDNDNDDEIDIGSNDEYDGNDNNYNNYNDDENENGEEEGEENDNNQNVKQNYKNNQNNNNNAHHEKRRLSRAERKKLKKSTSNTNINEISINNSHTNSSDDNVFIEDSNEKNKKNKTQNFVDSRYYMKYGNEDEVATYVEDALQPQSGLRNHETTGAKMLENAMLDLIPDDAIEMNKKKKMLRWDAKKRKYVKQSLEEMAQSKSGVKKIRTETGVVISKSNKPQGELYENWKKRTKKEVTLAGTGDEEDDRPRPNFKFNTHIPRETRNVHEIRKLHQKKSQDKLKNMKKDKRRSIEGKMRKEKAEQMNRGYAGTKAGNRKVKAVFRR